MASDAETIIAFIFKRSGKLELTYSDFYLTLSMDLNWFTPDNAKNFVNKALKNKLLEKKDEAICPGFNIEKINVPIGFYPSKRIFEEKTSDQKQIEEKDLIRQMVRKISSVTKISEEETIIIINKIQSEKNITLEVAALLFGKEHNVPFEDFYERIQNSFFKENKG